MSDIISFTETRGQHVELLPARTLLGGGGLSGAGQGGIGLNVLGGGVLGDPTDNGTPSTDTLAPGRDAKPLPV